MTFLYLACLNNDPLMQSLLGPKCNPVCGEPHIEFHKLTRCCKSDNSANIFTNIQFLLIQSMYKLFSRLTFLNHLISSLITKFIIPFYIYQWHFDICQQGEQAIHVDFKRALMVLGFQLLYSLVFFVIEFTVFG